MICKLPADKKVLIIILALLGALIIALTLTSCGMYYEDLSLIPRQHVNEKCRTFRNHWDMSDAEILLYVAGKIEGTSWKYIRAIRWTGADCGTDHRRGRIEMVVVYYE